jgi:hypothetical protein
MKKTKIVEEEEMIIEKNPTLIFKKVDKELAC